MTLNKLFKPSYLRLAGMLLAALLQYSCATESAPTGGKEDAEPPKLKSATPADKTLHFKGNKIELVFDEFIQPGGFAQTIISPPTQEKPEIKSYLKKVTIKLKSPLQPNTTYTINFGDDLKDLNQGNILNNFSYVFSTGDFIDSQKVSGTVKLAADGKPAEGFLVCLYNADSVNPVLNSKPLYFAKTNKDGQFSISNIKEGTYQAYALKDENFNYLYDQPNEQIGFIDTALVLTDSSAPVVSFFAFKENKKKIKLQSVKRLEPGKLIICYSAPFKTLKLDSEVFKNGYKSWNYETNDTLIVWYSDYYSEKTELFLMANDTLLDTVRLELKFLNKDSVERGTTGRLAIVNEQVGSKRMADSKESVNIQSPYGLLKINLSRPITEINADKQLVISGDSGRISLTSPFSVDEKTGQTLQADFTRIPDTDYTVTIPDSSFKDVFGLWNKPLVWKFRTNKKENYGNINVKLTISNTSLNYLVQLINSEGKVVNEINTVGKAEASKAVPNLPAGNYKIVVVVDDNGNGKWDTGNFIERRQPERIIPFTDVYNLKGNWDLDVEVKF